MRAASTKANIASLAEIPSASTKIQFRTGVRSSVPERRGVLHIELIVFSELGWLIRPSVPVDFSSRLLDSLRFS